MLVKSCFCQRSLSNSSNARISYWLDTRTWSALMKGEHKADLIDETSLRAISRNGCKTSTTSTKDPMETPSLSPRLAYHFCGGIFIVHGFSVSQVK